MEELRWIEELEEDGGDGVPEGRPVWPSIIISMRVCMSCHSLHHQPVLEDSGSL